MKVKVLLFAAAKDAAGLSVAELTLPQAATVEEMRHALVDAYPRLQQLAPSLLIAVNNRYAENAEAVTECDEIACFPPVSGG